MYYAKLISPSLVMFLVYFDPDRDMEYIDRLIDKGYKIINCGENPIARHISELFKELI